VVHNGKPEPAWRLDPAAKRQAAGAGNRGQVRQQDQPEAGPRRPHEPKDLDALALANRAFYYATASTLANAVFLLPEPEFKELVGGFAFFKVNEKVSLGR